MVASVNMQEIGTVQVSEGYTELGRACPDGVVSVDVEVVDMWEGKAVGQERRTIRRSAFRSMGDVLFVDNHAMTAGTKPEATDVVLCYGVNHGVTLHLPQHFGLLPFAVAKRIHPQRADGFVGVVEP